MPRLLIAVLLAGCCSTTIHGPEVDAPPGAELAVDVIAARYRDAFGSDPAFAIVWVESLQGDPAYRGRAHDCAALMVVVDPGDRPSDTAVAHELAHCFAGDIPERGCDPLAGSDHGEAWIWDPGTGVVADVNRNLEAIGL